MRHTKVFWLSVTLILGCLLFAAVATSSGSRAAAASNQATATNIVPLSRSLGMPAIHPSLSALSTTSGARFTTADVQAYLQTHPFFGGQLVKGATASVVTIQFMSSEQASTLIRGEETGLPPTATVCYVKLHGPFTQQGAPTAPGAKQLPIVDYGVEIFDAQTGNLLMTWTPSA